MLNLANFTGRVGWGFASDKMGRKSFYLLSAGVQALAVGFMALSIPSSNFGGWLASFLIIGSLYGGGFGVIPATVSVPSECPHWHPDRVSLPSPHTRSLMYSVHTFPPPHTA